MVALIASKIKSNGGLPTRDRTPVRLIAAELQQIKDSQFAS